MRVCKYCYNHHNGENKRCATADHAVCPGQGAYGMANGSNEGSRQNLEAAASAAGGGLNVVMVGGNQSASRKSLFENPEDKPDYSHDPSAGPQVRTIPPH